MTSAPATNELLACPFCGSEGHTLMRGFRHPEGSSDKESAIRCPTCECQGPLKSWNTRATATPSAQGAEVSVEELASEIDPQAFIIPASKRFEMRLRQHAARVTAAALLGKYRMEKR